MINKYIPINTILSVSIIVENQEIKNIKHKLFTLYNSNYNIDPHITLLIVPINENNAKKLIYEIRTYIETISIFPIKFEQIQNEENFFYFLVSGNKLLKIHKKLVFMSKQYTKNFIRKKDFNRIKTNYFTKQELKNINKYNYPRVLDSYIPHISLGNVNINKKLDYEKLYNDLNKYLNHLINKSMKVEKIKILFHTDNVNQSKMKILYEENIHLFNKSLERNI